MAYDFLNTTTYTNQLSQQEALLSQMQNALAAQQQDSPLGSGFDLNSYDSDLIEIVAANESNNQDSPSEEAQLEPDEVETPVDDRLDMDLINSMFDYNTQTSTPAPQPVQQEEDNEDSNSAYGTNGKVTPRIWQYGGNTLYADTYEQQRIGLNNPNYNTAVFSTKGTNTFRGLDNHQPVAITDGEKYKVLHGPQDTAKFNGKVYEQKLSKFQTGGTVPKNQYQRGTSETMTNLGRNLASYFLNVKNSSLEPSKYRPTTSKDPNAKYNTWHYLKNDVKRDFLSDKYIQRVNDQQKNFSNQDSKYLPSYITEKTFDQYYNYLENSPKSHTMSGSSANLGHYQVGPGKDDRGRYISVYDKYDWNLLEGLGIKGNSWETYDRLYEDEWDKIPEKQFGGDLKPETSEVKDFYNSYLNSPNYLKRLNTQGYINPNQAILDRLANIKNVTTSVDKTMESQYDAPNYTVVYNPGQAKELGVPMMSALAHEYGHTTGASQQGYLKNPLLELNSSEFNAFKNRNQLTKVNTASLNQDQKDQLEHDINPAESKADLDTLRYRLFKDKVYDTGTQQFSPEHLKQAKDMYKDDGAVNRLFKNYSDEDLIYLMNNVAKNNTNNNKTIYG